MFSDSNTPVSSAAVNETFKEKGVTLPCPRCGKKKFSLVGESSISLVLHPPSSLGELMTAVPSPSSIPVVIIGCDNCGYIIQHAKAPLGLSRWQDRSPR